MTDPLDSPHPALGNGAAGWTAYYRIDPPEGTFLHPRTTDVVEGLLRGRAPVIRESSGRLSLVCSIEASAPSDACRVADELGRLLLDSMGLPSSTLTGPVLHAADALPACPQIDAPVIPLTSTLRARNH